MTNKPQTLKRKHYFESTESLDWMLKNLPRQSESKFIRESVAERIENQKKKKVGSKICLYPQGNQLCTNGKDTYHQWNTTHGASCTFCGMKDMKKKVKTGDN
jgi:hypothetical protein